MTVVSITLQLRRRQSASLLAVTLLCALAAPSVRAQEPLPKPKPPTLPPLPLTESRPVEGDVAEQRFQTGREGADREPIASFLKTLQGSDAIIEVTLGQGRLLTTKKPIVNEKGAAVIAVGDPTILDFEVLPNPRMIRLIGKRPGVTDLSITTADDQTHVFEAHVVLDVALMNAQLRQLFPDADIRVSQFRGHLLIEGQARNISQVTAVDNLVRGFVASLEASGGQGGAGLTVGPPVPPPPAPAPGVKVETTTTPDGGPRRTTGLRAEVESGQRGGLIGAATTTQVINLMKVPGVQQVLLQVKIGELNRTGLREIGADWFVKWGQNGNRIGTKIAGATQTLNGLTGLGSSATAFGIFPSGDVEIVLRALRENSILNVLAEPNLMAMSGQRASFLAGGQFPVPVPQGGGGGGSNNVTIQFKDFGVQLSFLPFVLDDETIRLQVNPEVSSIDTSLGTTLVQGGIPVPGLNTRRVDTTVELKQGTTLALAGLLQVQLDAKTDRIPGLGDTPYIGPFFSNTSHKRVEKELMVLVTPYLVHSLTPDQVPPLPGSELQDPNDLEFYFLNRIEGRTGRSFRSTMSWDNPLHLVELLHLEQGYVCGPVGFSE
jgi:pilus assembly protein CpaC